MATNGDGSTIDGETLAQVLQKAYAELAHPDGEVVLDFGSIHRITSGSLRLIEELVAIADDKAVKVRLRGVNVGVYKVFKLVKLAPRVSFLT